MDRKKILIFFSLTILVSGSCQSQLSGTSENDLLFPTPFQETLEAEKIVPDITTSIISTPTVPDVPKSTPEIQISIPTETQQITTLIFPEVTQPYQPIHPELAEKIDQIIIQSGGRWHVVIKEVNGPTYYALLTEQRINIASVVKVPIAFLFFAALEEKGVSEYQLVEHIRSTGTGGRTFEQLLYAMLVKSEEDATEILAEYIGDYVNIPSQLQAWQLQSIDLEARRFTTLGIASLFERFYNGEFVSPTAQKLILSYLTEYTPNDETRIGILRNQIPENYQIYNKRGSLLTPYVVADSAIIENPDGKDYIITIFAFNGQQKTTYEILDKSIGDIALAFWEYISSE